MLKQPFGDDVLGQKQTNDWLNQIKNSSMLDEDDKHSGQSSIGTLPENVARV